MRDVVLLPLLWLYAIPLGIACAALDILATPFVWAIRAARPRSEPRARGRRVSIVIPSWNGRELLAELLPSLPPAIAKVEGPVETIVVDNGSDDGTVEFLRSQHPEVRIVQLPQNRYFVGGVRAGVEAAHGDILVLLNNDMRVEPDFLCTLLARFGDPDFFAATARIEMAGDRVETGRTRIVAKKGMLRFEQVDGPTDAPAIPAAWAGGGSSAYDLAKYRALDGMEELYAPCYAEDASLSYLAWRCGWRVEFVPDSVVHHRHRATSMRVFGRSRVEQLDRRNRELMFWRTVTDWRIVAMHVLFMPWNARKEARRTGVGVQILGVLRSIPRLPRALWLRSKLRVRARRSDREVLRIANDVSAYCRSARRKPPNSRTVTVFGAASKRDPAATSTAIFVDASAHDALDRLRRALGETYADSIVSGDPEAERLLAQLR
jgi:GT2 family glycosyltransferase